VGPVAVPAFSQTGSTLPQPRGPKDPTFPIMALLAAQAVATTTAIVLPVRHEWPITFRVTTGVWIGEAKAAVTPRDMLDEIKNASGLTWDQVGRTLGVSRRSVHLWLQGKTVSAANEERLHSVLYIVRLLAGRSQLDVRSKLLDKTGGVSVVELLGAGRDDDAQALARERAAATATPRLFEQNSDRSREVLDARRSSMSALDLLETGSGPVQTTGGKAKRARPMKRRTADAQ